MAWKAKESFSVIVNYMDGTIERIKDVKIIGMYTDKASDVQYYIFTKEDSIIHVPFSPSTLSSIYIEGTKDSKWIPDIYS